MNQKTPRSPDRGACRRKVARHFWYGMCLSSVAALLWRFLTDLMRGRFDRAGLCPSEWLIPVLWLGGTVVVAFALGALVIEKSPVKGKP